MIGDTVFGLIQSFEVRMFDLFTIMIMIYTRALLQTRMFVYMRVLY
jgi:hypothetical protein